jgi:hypothetical protein
MRTWTCDARTREAWVRAGVPAPRVGRTCITSVRVTVPLTPRRCGRLGQAPRLLS